MNEFRRRTKGKGVASRVVRYRSYFFTPGMPQYGPEFYETDVQPTEHAGCLIYERVSGKVWDVVLAGVCIMQRAGLWGAKEAAEMNKTVYVGQYNAFWRLTLVEWVAICRGMLTDQGRLHGYQLPENRRLKGKPVGVSKNRTRSGKECFSIGSRGCVIYVEPLDWKPDEYRSWLETFGLSAVEPSRRRREEPPTDR